MGFELATPLLQSVEVRYPSDLLPTELHGPFDLGLHYLVSHSYKIINAYADIDVYPLLPHFAYRFYRRIKAQTLNPHTADCTIHWDCRFSDSPHL